MHVVLLILPVHFVLAKSAGSLPRITSPQRYRSSGTWQPFPSPRVPLTPPAQRTAQRPPTWKYAAHDLFARLELPGVDSVTKPLRYDTCERLGLEPVKQRFGLDGNLHGHNRSMISSFFQNFCVQQLFAPKKDAGCGCIYFGVPAHGSFGRIFLRSRLSASSRIAVHSAPSFGGSTISKCP